MENINYQKYFMYEKYRFLGNTKNKQEYRL